MLTNQVSMCVAVSEIAIANLTEEKSLHTESKSTKK